MIIGEDQNGFTKIWIKFPCDGYYLRWWYNGWHYWYFLPGTISFETEGENYYTLGTQKIAMCSGQINYAQCQAIRTILNTKEVDIWTDVGWKSTRLERDSVIVYDNKVNGYEIEFVMVMGSRHISDSGYSPNYVLPPVGPPIDPPIVPPVYVSDCPNGDCVIGTQVWMSCNWATNYPGSRVYNDDEANRDVYGGLYTYSQVIASDFVPTGWHIPTQAEWLTLANYLGGIAAAGGSLKDSGLTYWNAPNNIVSPISCFEARGNGLYYLGVFSEIGESANLWASDGVVKIDHDSVTITINPFILIIPTASIGVRLIRDTPAGPGDVPYTGYGALYNWFAISVPVVLYTGYGVLYNWWVVDSGLLAPAGWRTPSNDDFATLAAYLGGNAAAGGKLKEAGLGHWDSPNEGADNSSGFTALPAGFRRDDGTFENRTTATNLWSDDFSGDDPAEAYDCRLDVATGYFYQGLYGQPKKCGGSVRCILNGADPDNPGSMSDIDGNIYPTVKIGTQVWMAANLTVEHYNDGTPITIEPDATAWAALSSEAMCYYV
jgi:uncharacterized protein (TIGR02145 family)